MADLRPTSCRTKNHYPTADEADTAAKRLTKQWGWLLESYRCPHCDEWHLRKTLHDGQPVVYVPLPE